MSNNPTDQQDQLGEALHREAVAHFRAGKYAEASAAIQSALGQRETSIRWNDYGTIELALGRVPGAEFGYRRATELDSQNSLAAANLIVLLERSGRSAEADPYRALVPASTLAQEQERAAAVAEKYKETIAVKAALGQLSRIPLIDPSLPSHLQEAYRRSAPNSRYYAHEALRVIEALPVPFRPALLDVLCANAGRNYLCGVVVALHYMRAGFHAQAQPLLENAFTHLPEDLFVGECLIECRQRLKRPGETDTFDGMEQYLAGSDCGQPWNHLEVTDNGNVYMCCPSWLPLSLGNIAGCTPEDLWNSAIAREIRASIQDGSFRYCNKLQCPHIAGRTLGKKPAAELQELLPLYSPGPTRVALAYDESCNLSCPQCRRDVIMASPQKQALFDRTFKPFALKALISAKTLNFNNFGEVFASRHSRELLRELNRRDYPTLKFELITNAQLFDRKNYEEFDLAGRIERIKVSVDAACAETYAVVRRGGDFDRLLANLAFLDGLRVEGRDQFKLELFFVVSALNYREMPAFVQLAEKFHADLVLFTAIKGSIGLTKAELDSLSVCNPSHALHQDYLQVLRSPELRDPIVKGNCLLSPVG
jgi:tetratricopeptide (TPR) repeat protein